MLIAIGKAEQPEVTSRTAVCSATFTLPVIWPGYATLVMERTRESRQFVHVSVFSIPSQGLMTTSYRDVLEELLPVYIPHSVSEEGRILFI